eukprot:scaffold292233_cov30-Tisochrysis_lutea.AAC.1
MRIVLEQGVIHESDTKPFWTLGQSTAWRDARPKEYGPRRKARPCAEPSQPRALHLTVRGSVGVL